MVKPGPIKGGPGSLSAGASDTTTKLDIKPLLKGCDFGLTGGLGFDFRSGLSLELRLSKGLTDINDNDSFTSPCCSRQNTASEATYR